MPPRVGAAQNGRYLRLRAPTSGSFPPLEAVVATPVFDAEGHLVSTPGYHKEARLWFHRAEGFDVVEVAERPTDEDVRAARELLIDDLLVDFPFAARSDRAHAVAAMVLPFVRRMVSGCTPIHLLEAPTPGSGKGLLADVLAIVALGRACDPTTITPDEDEARKKITSILARAQPLILRDNVKDGLDSAQLASALTAETWSDRLLGQTKMIDLPNRATWLVTANNPHLSLEIEFPQRDALEHQLSLAPMSPSPPSACPYLDAARKRIWEPGDLLSIVGRGHAGRPLFATDDDRLFFVERLARAFRPGAVDLLGWALLVNHYHLLLRITEATPEWLFRRLNTAIGMRERRRRGDHGTVFQGRYWSGRCGQRRSTTTSRLVPARSPSPSPAAPATAPELGQPRLRAAEHGRGNSSAEMCGIVRSAGPSGTRLLRVALPVRARWNARTTSQHGPLARRAERRLAANAVAWVDDLRSAAGLVQKDQH